MISLWLLLMGTLSANTGTVSTIDSETNVAQVVFYLGAEPTTMHIPTFLIPCNIERGQLLYVRKTEDMTLVRCSAFPVIPPAPQPTLEVRVNPTTGEMQYVIQNIPLE